LTRPVPRVGRLALAALTVTACINLNDTNEPTRIWEATLVPEIAYPDLTGQVAVISSALGTQMGIGIAGAEFGSVHAWSLWLGTCAEPGVRFGGPSDYPDLEVTISGTAETEALFGARLDATRNYSAEVTVSAADSSRVACGDLALTQ